MKTIYNLALALVMTASASAFDQSHKNFDALLKKNVTSKGVKYKSLKKEHPALKSYIAELSSVKSSEFKKWSEGDQLAYLINLYNAATIDLVLDNYPIKSFKDEVGGKTGPWKVSFIKALGSTYSLDDVEHKLIRAKFNEPRIHFALNCASAGCPPLRAQAFTGANLETQLKEQTEAFLKDTDKNKVSKGSIAISPIFDWFKDDFIKKSGSVEAFIDPYFPKTKIKKGISIKYTDYGWSLNEH